MQAMRLEQMLLSEGVLQRSELEAAMAAASGQQKRLALTLLEMNLIDERELAEFLSRHTGHPLVEPLPHELPTWVYRRVPGPIARTYFAAPLEVSDRQIKVALLDPTDQAAIDVLATATQMTVVPSVAIHSSLEKFFNRIYPIDVDMDATIVSERSFEAEESTSEPALSEMDPSLGTMAIDRSTLNQENPVIEPEQPTAPPERPAQKGSPPDYRAQLEEIWRAVRALQDDVRELKKHRERKPFL